MTSPSGPANPLFLRDDDLRQGLDVMRRADRRLMAQCDDILEEMALGRAHQRALHTLALRPGGTMTELLSVLRITKQSLSRVIGDLGRRALVRQEAGRSDRRQRLLYLTEAGQQLERRLYEAQRSPLLAAYRAAGAEAVAGFRAVLGFIADGTAR